jgi:hypothetical protein
MHIFTLPYIATPAEATRLDCGTRASHPALRR